jgi:hypothetical protein
MSYARQLLDTYPGTINVDAGVRAAADALSDCAQACIADVDLVVGQQRHDGVAGRAPLERIGRPDTMARLHPHQAPGSGQCRPC